MKTKNEIHQTEIDIPICMTIELVIQILVAIFFNLYKLLK